MAEAKARWRRQRRLYRPGVPVPGQHLVIDWTLVKGGLQMFCAVLAWSRYRFVRFARDGARRRRDDPRHADAIGPIRLSLLDNASGSR